MHTGKGDQSGKEELFWQAMEQIISQWFCFSVETSERHQQLQDTIPQNTGESTTRRRSEWVILQVWKNTIHTTLLPLLHCRSEKMMCARSSKITRKGRHQAQRCVTSLPKNLCWPAGPHLHTDIQQITGAVRSPLMLQMLRHHPRPKETQNYWT